MNSMRTLLLVLLSGIALNSQAQKGYQCKWQGDLTGKEIPGDWYTTVKKGGINYCFSNDNSCLFLNMKITESEEQSRILKSGLTLWIDNEGKSKKKTGVRFPVGSDYSGVRKSSFGTPQPTPLSLANTIQLVGFNIGGQARIPSDNPDGLRGKVFYDEGGDLIYSLVIPFETMPDLQNSGGKPLSLGIEIGAPPQMPAGRPQGFPQGGGGGIPAGGGRPGGGGGGRGMPPSGGGMPPSSQGAAAPAPLMIWVKDARLSAGK